MKKPFIHLIALSPLAMIFVGCWLVHPPAAFIAVGLLMWFDLKQGDEAS